MDHHSNTPAGRTLATIQTSYALAAFLVQAAAFVEPEDTAETGPRRCQAPRQNATVEAISRTEVGPAIPSTCKETRCKRRAKRKKLLAEANGGVRMTTVKRAAVKLAFNMAQSHSFTLANAARGDLEAAEGGWLGSRKRVSPEGEITLEELLECGLELVEWDGVTPHPLLDTSGYVIAVLAGRATGTFDDVLLEATSEFERHSMTLPPVEETIGKQPTRGAFHAVFTGISYGGGQLAPMHTAIPKMYQNAVNELRASKAVQRLAGLQNQTFKTFFPKIHGYYEAELSKLYRISPRLRPPYESSIMPAAAYNLGPTTICRPHRDSANLSFGICAITALGRFDPKAGGHLVLRELGLVIEFPPGATVLIPSAVITHYNTKLPEGMRRYSFTQYAAGSLFSYIQNGMRSERDVLKDSTWSLAEKAAHAEARRERWGQGLALFPHISDYTNVAQR